MIDLNYEEPNPMKKQCSKCKKKKEYSEFLKDKRTKSGLYSACKRCHYPQVKAWRKNNPDRAKELFKDWAKRNPEKVRRNYNNWEKQRRKINPQYRLDKNISCIIRSCLNGKKAGRSWERLVGYSLNDLVKHLEKKFDDKMTWDNYGSYWHVDHMMPRSHFKYKTPEDPEFKKCWALDNLQPLEAMANIKKSNRIS